LVSRLVRLLFVFCLITSLVTPSSQAQSPLLEEKHAKASVVCKSCHGEDNTAKVAMGICISCHGDYAQLAEKTKKVAPNPHDSHLGAAECSACHHIHKSSEDGCRTCHTWGFKTP
jgi:hypothetical protein